MVMAGLRLKLDGVCEFGFVAVKCLDGFGALRFLSRFSMTLSSTQLTDYCARLLRESVAPVTPEAELPPHPALLRRQCRNLCKERSQESCHGKVRPAPCAAELAT